MCVCIYIPGDLKMASQNYSLTQPLCRRPEYYTYVLFAQTSWLNPSSIKSHLVIPKEKRFVLNRSNRTLKICFWIIKRCWEAKKSSNISFPPALRAVLKLGFLSLLDVLSTYEVVLWICFTSFISWNYAPALNFPPPTNLRAMPPGKISTLLFKFFALFNPVFIGI